jgi:hypothetical protein
VLVGRSAEQLDEQRAGHVEALGRERVHLRVELHALAGDATQARPDASRRDEERGQHEQGEQRQPPGEREHDRERHDERDHVRDDRAECARERLLRSDHVVVEPRLERPRLRAREERDRHPLHVVEERDAQVEDQSFPDP